MKRTCSPLAQLRLAFTPLCLDAVFRETARYTLPSIALTRRFIAPVPFPRCGPMRLLNWRPIALAAGAEA